MVDNRGNLTLAMACILAVHLACGMGLWKAIREHRAQVGLQLKMDRCLGQEAQSLRDTLNQVEAWNGRIRALRLSIAAATVRPELRPPLTAALWASVRAQDVILTAWSARRAQALVPESCGISGWFRMPPPVLDYRRPPPDPMGPQALYWPDQPTEFQMEGHTLHRRSDARVSRNAQKWEAHWGRRRTSPG